MRRSTHADLGFYAIRITIGHHQKRLFLIIKNKILTSIFMALMVRVDHTCRTAHLARRTREQYLRWIEQFIRFHRDHNGSWRTPAELRGADVAAFLTHLAVARRLSASSQNQGLCAILFLYQSVLRDELPKDHLGDIHALRSTRPKTLPTVLSTGEVRRLLAAIPPGSDQALLARLMYGTTTMIYTHIASTLANAVQSPLDRLVVV